MSTINRISFSLAACMSLLFIFASTASAATASSTPSKPLDTGLLYASHQTATTIFPKQLNTFTAEFRASTTPITALADIELFDQNGKQLLQKDWDTISLVKGSSTIFSLTSPRNLAPGVYTWKASLFTPGWKQQINWYDSAATFAVLGTTTSTSTSDRALLGGLWQKDNKLRSGESQYISANFNTPDQSVGTYIQFDLFDADNNIVLEKGWDNTYLGYGYDTTKTITTPALDPGNYHWGISIFTVGRKNLKAWIDNIAPFIVASSTDSLLR